MAWQKGESGNPLGRPRGTKDKLCGAFLKDLYADWQEHGRKALKAAREAEPAAYCMLVARLVPKDVHLDVNASEALLNALRVISEPAEEVPEGSPELRAGDVAGHA